MAGSIIEAVLIDALGYNRGDPERLDKISFEKLINEAKVDQILDGESVDLSTVIRKYRNLIHPGVVKRSEKTVEKSGAIVAAELVDILVRQVAKRKQETYGSTAKQLLERLSGGPSSLPALQHLLTNTKEQEIELLLTRLLPEEYARVKANADTSPAFLKHLAVCYRRVFDNASEPTKKKVCNNLSKVYRGSDESKAVDYEDSFFKCDDLSFFEENDRVMIKDHFLPRITFDGIGGRLDSLAGIGKFLNDDEAIDLASMLLDATKSDNASFSKRAENRLVSEYAKMKSESRSLISELVKLRVTRTRFCRRDCASWT